MDPRGSPEPHIARMFSKSTLGGIVCALLVLVAGVWWMQDTARDRGLRGLQRAVAGADSEPRAAVLPHGSEGAIQTSPQSTPGAQRDAVPTQVAPGPTRCVRVVLASTGAPVPDARVWLQREEVEWSSPEWWRAMRRFNDVEPVLQEGPGRGGLGRELELDARGTACVPRPARELSVAAARGTLHGDATLRPGDSECVVKLKEYHALSVEVVDASDQPVEAALVVLTWGDFDPLEHDAAWLTDEHGRVWIPKLENHLWGRAENERGEIRLTLGAGVPCQPESVLFPLDAAPTDPVRLVAGPHGRVVLQLCDPRGAELALDGHSSLDLLLEAVPEASLVVRAGAKAWRSVSAGRALYGAIGLGYLLHVSVSVQGHESVWREVLGPTEEGEEVRVAMPIATSVETRRTTIRAEVHGLPASFQEAETPGAFLEGRSEEAKASFTFWVQEGAHLEEPLGSSGHPSALAGPWTLELGRHGGPILQTSCVPRLDEHARVLDFGDVVFQPAPLLARLQVVDDAGAALPGARIETQPALHRARSWCDDEGRWVLQGALSDLPVRVRASHPSRLPCDWVNIERPASELTLVLQRGASLEGRLLLPRGANLEDFGLALSIRRAAPPPTLHETEPVEGGRFRFQACEPGRATLSVSHAEHLLYEQADIELVDGRRSELADIDLRTLLHPFALTFGLEGGAPWRGGHLEVCDPDGTLSTWTRIGPSGRACVLAPHTPLDLWVAGLDARARLFENVHDGDHLVLADALSVLLRLPREIRLPAAPLVLRVHGERLLPETATFETPVFETYDEIDCEDATVSEDGTARLQVNLPGDYELTWFVSHAATGVRFGVSQEEPQTIHVADSASAAAIEVRLEPDALARAIREAGE